MAATVLPVEDERKLRDLVRSYLERAGSSLLTGLVVARRITRPVERLIAVTRAMGRGERTARVGPISAPGEIGELATLAAADAAALQLTVSQQDLAEITASAADSLAGRFEAAGITLDRRLTSVAVLADPGRLHQLIPTCSPTR